MKSQGDRIGRSTPSNLPPMAGGGPGPQGSLGFERPPPEGRDVGRPSVIKDVFL